MSAVRVFRSSTAFTLALILALAVFGRGHMRAQDGNPNAPVIVPLSDQSNAEGDTITPFQIVASDPNGSALTYSVDFLPQGITYDPDTHTVSGTVGWLAAGGYPTIRVTVVNANGDYARAYFDWAIAYKDAPGSVAVSPTLSQDSSGDYLLSTPRGVPITTLTLAGTDPDPCDGVHFALNSGQALPAGLTLTPPADYGANPGCTAGFVWPATISGTPTAQGTTTFTINDANPAVPLATFVWTVTNTPPVLTAVSDRTAAAGSPFSLTVTGTDANGDALVYSASNLPVGLVINPLTGLLSGTPDAAGTYVVSLGATDGHGGTAQETFTLTTTGTPAMPSCTPDANGHRVPGLWCPGDLFVGLGATQEQPELDSNGQPVLDDSGNPILTEITQHRGEYLQLDANGHSLSDHIFDAGLDRTNACTIDPTTGDLWTASLWTNLIGHIAAPTTTLSHTLLAPIDITQYVRTNDCGTDSANPHAGCGAASSVLLDRAGNLYVGTVDGTNKILKFDPSGTLLNSYTVPVGARGTSWIDLAVDQKTMFYTSEDNTIRVFSVDGQPLPQALFDAGVTHLDDPVLDPNHTGLFGAIVVKDASGDPLATQTYRVRLLPPGDGTGDLLVVFDVYVSRIDLTGHVVQDYPDDNSAYPLSSFEITPDGTSIWMMTAANDDWTSPSVILRSHLPTATTIVDPLTGSDWTALGALCINGAYTAAVVQPDCIANPTNAMCQPLPVCPADSPECVPPAAPIIQQPADQSNLEGDTITPIQISATDPNGSPLTYTVEFLPLGLSFEPSTRVIYGTVDWLAAQTIGAPSTNVRVTVTNAQGFMSRVYFNWTIVYENAPPSATLSSQLPVNGAGAYVISTPHGVPITPIALQGTDPDACTGVNFQLASGSALPAGVTLTPQSVSNPACTGGVVYPATLAGTPTTDGTTTFTIQSDSLSPLATFVWTVTNVPPMIASVPNQQRNTNFAMSLAMTASDANSDTLTFSATNLPTGLAIDTGSGVITGTPTVSGVQTVTVTVEDGHGGTASTAFQLTVAAAPPAVTILLTSPFAGTVFAPSATINVQATATVSNGTIATVTFLAAGVSIGTATTPPYQLSWSGMTQGTYQLTAVATDNLGITHRSNAVTVGVLSAANANDGVLGPPTLSLGSGTYGPNHLVSLTADPSATIRFTTDGSLPTGSSSIYSAPIALTQTMTINAGAFEAAWDPSVVTTGVYTIVNNPLVISAVLSPPPNAAGWNRSPVTATFTCADDGATATCPASLQFSNDGANQTATVSASDSLGNQATATVVVNIDTTPPSVAVTSPVDGTTTTNGVVSLSGSVSDTGSGAASATCNGIASAIVDGSISCSIPLRKGVNTVILQVMDAAGNSSSTGLRAILTGTPTELSLTPTTRKLVVGELTTLAAVSDYGPVTDVTWASSDSNIVAVAGDGSGALTGMAPGQVTVTATTSTLSANATVTVTSTSLGPGDSVWNVAPPAGSSAFTTTLLPAHRADDSAPDTFAVTPDYSTYPPTYAIAGLAVDGSQVSFETTDEQPLFGSRSGGLIALTVDDQVEKIFGSESALPWRYQTPDTTIIQSWPVQGPDGTIYFVEGVYDSNYDDAVGYVVGLDGETGAVIFRTPLPLFTMTTNAPAHTVGCGTPSTSHSVGNGSIAIGIGGDGAAYIELDTGHQNIDRVCDLPGRFQHPNDANPTWIYVPDQGVDAGAGTDDYLSQLTLVRVDNTGASSETSLAQQSYFGPDTSDVALETLSPGTIVSDAQQGAFVSWTFTSGVDDNPGFAHVAGSDITPLPASLAPYGENPVELATSSGTAYIYDSDGALAAFDANSWTRLWTGSPSAVPVFETDYGTLFSVVNSDDGTSAALNETDRTGTVLSTAPLPWLDQPFVLLHAQGSLLGTDINGSSTDVAIPERDEVDSMIVVASRSGGDPALLGGHCDLAPLLTDTNSANQRGLLDRTAPYHYSLMGAWPATASAAVRSAFNKWNAANAFGDAIDPPLVRLGHIGTTFAEWAPATDGNADDPIDIEVNFTFLPNKVNLDTNVPSAQGGNTTPVLDGVSTFLSGGHIHGVTVNVQANPMVVDSSTGWTKVMLHEIGHAHGLDDNLKGKNHESGDHGSSVMNLMGALLNATVQTQRMNDFGGNIATVVRTCDEHQAVSSARR